VLFNSREGKKVQCNFVVHGLFVPVAIASFTLRFLYGEHHLLFFFLLEMLEALISAHTALILLLIKEGQFIIPL